MKTGRPKGPETELLRLRVKTCHLEGIKRWFKAHYGYEQPDAYWEQSSFEELGMAAKAVSKPVEAISKPSDTSALEEENRKLKNDNFLLLASLDHEEKKRVELEAKVQRVARLTENEKLILWIRKYDALVEKVKAKYPDEGF